MMDLQEHKPHSTADDFLTVRAVLATCYLGHPDDEGIVALDRIEEQLEAAQRELQDATRIVAALVYRTNKTSGVLLYPTDLRENLTLSRHDNPLADTVHLFASNPASSPKEGA